LTIAGGNWRRQFQRKRSDVKEDALDALIEASAAALTLPIEPAWKPTIKASLAVTLQLANFVAEFQLPDEAEPAPVFEA
jgi:hypothetical protein